MVLLLFDVMPGAGLWLRSWFRAEKAAKYTYRNQCEMALNTMGSKMH